MTDTCANCINYVVSHDRHGFSDGLYEDNSLCSLRDGEDNEAFYELLNEIQKVEDKAGTLGWLSRCPSWLSRDG